MIHISIWSLELFLSRKGVENLQYAKVTKQFRDVNALHIGVSNEDSILGTVPGYMK